MGKEVRHKLVVIAYWLVSHRYGLLGFSESNEFDWDGSSLVQELEETVLSIGSRLSEVDNCCFVCNSLSFQIDSFSIAFHVKLLDVGSELAQSLAIRNDCSCAVFLYGGSVESNKPQ